MPDSNQFRLFPLLSPELRLLIWTHTLEPRIIALKAEGYAKDKEPTAVPHHLIKGTKPPNVDSQVTRKMWSGQFILAEIPSQAIFQVSKESRDHALSSGYKTWKMQAQGGLVRNIIWNPAKDFVLFPHRTLDEDLDSNEPFVHPHDWLRMFLAQYPTETSTAQNVALYTSLWFRLNLERKWVITQLLKFCSMRTLVVVIDEKYEKQRVMELAARGLTEERWGAWKLPHAIVETLEGIKARSVGIELTVPDVRLVEDIDGILTSPGMVAILQCYPCESLGIY